MQRLKKEFFAILEHINKNPLLVAVLGTVLAGVISSISSIFATSFSKSISLSQAQHSIIQFLGRETTLTFRIYWLILISFLVLFITILFAKVLKEKNTSNYFEKKRLHQEQSEEFKERNYQNPSTKEITSDNPIKLVTSLTTTYRGIWIYKITMCNDENTEEFYAYMELEPTLGSINYMAHGQAWLKGKKPNSHNWISTWKGEASFFDHKKLWVIFDVNVKHLGFREKNVSEYKGLITAELNYDNTSMNGPIYDFPPHPAVGTFHAQRPLSKELDSIIQEAYKVFGRNENT